MRVLKNIITSHVAGLSDQEADRAIAAKGDIHYVADGGNKDTAVMPCGQVVGLVNEVIPVRDLFFNMVSGARAIMESLDAIVSGGRS